MATGGVFLLYHDKSVSGFVLLGGAIATILGAGFFGRRLATTPETQPETKPPEKK